MNYPTNQYQKPQTDKPATLGGVPEGFGPWGPPSAPAAQPPPQFQTWSTPQPGGTPQFPAMTVPPIQPPHLPAPVTAEAVAPAPAQQDMVWCVVKIARQDRGEFVFVVTEAVFADKDKAWQHASQLGQKNWWEKIMGVDCWCERGVHESPFHK